MGRLKTIAEVIPADPQNIEKIVAHILNNKIVAMPYGKKERRIFALIGLANDDVVMRMKKIKERSTSQAVAVSGIPDVAPSVAKLSSTLGLMGAAKRLNINPQQVIEKCFDIGGVGLILVAKDWLPEGATMINSEGKRTVLIAGEASEEDYDIFPQVYRHLIRKHKKVMVGTSANIHGDDTYHVLQQDEALEKLKEHIDVFVYDKLKFGLLPFFKHFTSTTMIDLSINPPKVIRWGSIHPNRFKEIFPNLIFNPKNLKHYKGRERLHHILLKEILHHIRRLVVN